MPFSIEQILIALLSTIPAFAQLPGFSEHDPLYRLQATDQLEIHYRYTPEFNQTIVIQPDGFASLQVVGDVKLQGLTLAQAKSAILSKASERLNDPEISILLKEFDKPHFVVAGEVGAPGRFDIRGSVSAVQAIAMAGGFKSSSKHSQVILFRRIGPDLAKTQILNLKDVMNGKTSEPNIDLRPGDMLVVPQNRISKIERIIKIANIGAYVPIY